MTSKVITLSTPNIPFERSYWVIPGKFLAGCYPASSNPRVNLEKLTALFQCGIRRVLNLMEEDETDNYGKPFIDYQEPLKELAKNAMAEMSFRRYPIKDVNIPEAGLMREILDDIDTSIRNNKPVYVHCWGGRGRTGTVVGCYLVRGGLSGNDALGRIKKLRKGDPTAHKPSPEVDSQTNMVLGWSETKPPELAFVKGNKVCILSGKHAQKTGTIQNFYPPRNIYRVKLDTDGKIAPQKPENIQSAAPNSSDLADRCRGSLFGLAIGDAVGTTLEFKLPGTFAPITDMAGGGPFHLKPGEWTDDTSMALCLAASLIEKGYDPKDQMNRYLKWHRDGYMSSNGKCFDIGNTVVSALNEFKKTGNPYSGSSKERSAGNGSLMRLAPVPLFFVQDPTEAIEKSGDSSRTTHGHQACIDACRYYAGLIIGALKGASKHEILSARYCPIKGYWSQNKLHADIDTIAAGSFKHKNPPEISGSGYVVKTLEAALWAFYHTDTFESGCLKVVNLGKDADTTGAVYGQLAGAFYGCESISQKWRNMLAKKSLLESMADALIKLSLQVPNLY